MQSAVHSGNCSVSSSVKGSIDLLKKKFSLFVAIIFGV